MHESRIILESDQFNLSLQRLAHELIEKYDNFDDVCIIGIQERGVCLASRIIDILNNKLNSCNILFGKLDITFYRDDFRLRKDPLKASSTLIDFSIDDKKIILVDDVLYTGRTIHAAIAALQDIGRASKIELLTMVDRRFNRHLPIRPDYKGITVDALNEAYVKVKWKETDGVDEILFFSANPKF